MTLGSSYSRMCQTRESDAKISEPPTTPRWPPSPPNSAYRGAMQPSGSEASVDITLRTEEPMIVQWCCKGFANMTEIDARAILSGGSGIRCRGWLATDPHPFPVDEGLNR